MGRDMCVESKTKEYEEKFLKYRWRDIEWCKIFDLIGMDLLLLYDNYISYWCTPQLSDILSQLEELYDNPVGLFGWEGNEYGEEQLEKAEKYHDDIKILIVDFKDFVENNAQICVF